jgi:hypothetical protein
MARTQGCKSVHLSEGILLARDRYTLSDDVPNPLGSGILYAIITAGPETMANGPSPAQLPIGRAFTEHQGQQGSGSNVLFNEMGKT